LPEQHERVAWAVVGEVGLSSMGEAQTRADGDFSLAVWHRLAEVMGLTARLEPASEPGFHPGRCAAVTVGDQVIGHVGELAPAAARAFEIDVRVAVAEMDLGPILAPVEPVLSTAPSPYPHVDFDLSFVVAADLPARSLIEATTGAAGGLVESSRVFDEFKGESLGVDQKALAIRYRLRAPDRTLDAKEIGSVRESMIRAAEAEGATLRGA
jgi:phenylalanyl-tRNA synthetase beta chain